MTTRWRFLVILGLTLLIGVALGVSFDRRIGPAGRTSLTSVFQGWQPSLADDQLKNLESVWQAVHRDYVSQSIDDQQLVDGLISGLVGGLGDPYSSYLNRTEAADFERALSGTFEGIGLEIGYKNNLLTVVAPLPNTPAAEAGLEAGDVLLSIDGQDSSAMKLEEAVRAIRGPQGTKVTLEIRRRDEAAARSLTIVRRTITVEPVRWRLISAAERRFGYIEINNFNDQTSQLFRRAARDLLSQSVDGFIIDLRNNAGGLLDQSIKVISSLVASGPAVIEEYRGGQRKTMAVDGSAFLTSHPVAILVNEGTASASEIVAGALQDAGRAKIIGATTFGKGSVQDLRELHDGAALKLTVAKWLTPRGRSISDQGITPDIAVTLSPEDSRQGRDPQLERAQEWLATQQP